MRIPRLFIDMMLVTGETICLPRDKAHHISHVLRMRTGDVIKLFNDSGDEYESRIIEITKKNAQLEIGVSSCVANESPLSINLCLAIARGQHMDLSIQKAVELGVNTITPLISAFSNVKLQDNRIENKLAHWQNIIISAAEQCGRNKLAQLQNPVAFSEWLDTATTMTRIMLHPGKQQSLSSVKSVKNKVALIIGPEGGFSEPEAELAQEKGCVLISVGPRILRTETAVISAVSNAQQLWGDLN
jgi:16S rRNA (uracil1498-N3)-methyltransferase